MMEMASEERTPTPIETIELESIRSAEESLRESPIPQGSRPSTASSQDLVQAQQVHKGRKILVTTAEKSTVHGFPSLASFKVHLGVKFLWSLTMLVAWAFAAYSCYGLMKLYTRYEKTTAISVVPEAPTNFPAVSFCSINPYDGSMSRILMDIIKINNNISASASKTAVEFAYSANDHFKAYFESELGKYIYALGFVLTQLMIGCRFEGRTCGPADFYWYHDYYYGNCFRFNGGETVNQSLADYNFRPYDIKKSSKTGWKKGLQLELFAGSASQQQYTPKIGFRVIVHNQSIVPFPDEDGIDVPTGQETNVAVSRTFMRRLPDPFSNCITEITEKDSAKNDIFKEMYLQKQQGKIFQYQANYCQKICYQYFIIEQCSCYTLSLNFMNLEKTRNENTTGCLSFDQVKCLERADKDFYGVGSKKCYDLCPNECNQVSYKLSSTMASTVDFNATQYSISTVNIFYDSFTYQVMEEQAKISLYITISGMAGNLGLFTGMSMLSAVEFLEIIISFLIFVVVIKLSRCFEMIRRSLNNLRRTG